MSDQNKRSSILLGYSTPLDPQRANGRTTGPAPRGETATAPLETEPATMSNCIQNQGEKGMQSKSVEVIGGIRCCEEGYQRLRRSP